MLVYIDIGNWTLCNLLTDLYNCYINNKTSLIRNLREEHIEYKTVIIIQYTIAKNILFVAQSNKIYNKINTDHSPTWFGMYNNQ